MDDDNLQSALALLHELVPLAAAPSLRYFRGSTQVDNKDQGGFDPVTLADRETESVLRAAIEQRYPGHGFAGEEHGAIRSDARYQWVVDPIDGTRAYICGLPTWATLIALCDRNKPIAGLMSQPYVEEYFIGGGGVATVYRRGSATTLTTAETHALSGATLFATSPEMFSERDDRQRFDALSKRVRMTRYGVDSYAYCMLAAGHVDLVVEAGLGFYDIAALVPLIVNAGGVVTDWRGGEVRSGGRVLAAANLELHLQARHVLDGQ